MSKVVLIIAAIVLIGAGIFFFLNQRNNSTPTTSEAVSETSGNTQTASDQPSSGTGSLMEIMKLGGSRMCTWSGDQGGHAMNGTVYMSGKKVRSEATSTIEQIGPFTAYMVAIDDDMTMWTSLAPDNKTHYTKAELEAQSTTTDAQNKQSFEQFKAKYNYSCQLWTPDESKFVVN